MTILNFTDAAKKKFHKLTERGYDPSVLKEYVHMQSILNHNVKWRANHDVRGTDHDNPTVTDSK
jgi:hypothetical protein